MIHHSRTPIKERQSKNANQLFKLINYSIWFVAEKIVRNNEIFLIDFITQILFINRKLKQRNHIMQPGYEWWPHMKYAAEWNRKIVRIEDSMYSWKTIFSFAELCWIVHIEITCKTKLTFFSILCSKKLFLYLAISFSILSSNYENRFVTKKNVFFFWNILIISPDAKKGRWRHHTPLWIYLYIKKLIKIKCRHLLMRYICWKVILHYNFHFVDCHSVFGT